jgi:site-specific recombinase XerD
MDPTADALIRSFEQHLRARNRARTTITNYMGELVRGQAALKAEGKSLATVTKADIEEHIAEILGRRSANTAAQRYKAFRIFFKWLEDEEDIPSPWRG